MFYVTFIKKTVLYLEKTKQKKQQQQKKFCTVVAQVGGFVSLGAR